MAEQGGQKNEKRVIAVVRQERGKQLVHDVDGMRVIKGDRTMTINEAIEDQKKKIGEDSDKNEQT